MDASHARVVLASLAGLEPERQLHRLQAEGLPPLLVEQWWGHERLGDGFDYWVDVLHVDAGLPISEGPGRKATLITRLDDGQDHVRCGYIAAMRLLDTDGGLARYRLHCVPWTWLLGHARHSRVYQARSVREIVEDVLGGHAELARWRWSDDAVADLAAAPARSYCVQYRESDLAFVQRLLAEEGIAGAFESDEEGALTLVLFSDSSAQPENPQSARDGGIRFHRHDGTEQADALQALGARRQLGSNRLSLVTSDYKGPVVRHAQLPLQGAGHGSREVYDPAGAHAFADAGDGQRRARLAAEAHEAGLGGWWGEGTVRSLQAGRFIRVLAMGSGSVPVILPTEILHHGCNPPPVAQGRDQRRAAPPAPLAFRQRRAARCAAGSKPGNGLRQPVPCSRPATALATGAARRHRAAPQPATDRAGLPERHRDVRRRPRTTPTCMPTARAGYGSACICRELLIRPPPAGCGWHNAMLGRV